jgi:hypothetical protein
VTVWIFSASLVRRGWPICQRGLRSCSAAGRGPSARGLGAGRQKPWLGLYGAPQSSHERSLLGLSSPEPARLEPGSGSSGFLTLILRDAPHPYPVPSVEVVVTGPLRDEPLCREIGMVLLRHTFQWKLKTN